MSCDYPGTELGLFQEAVRWKAYWASEISPFLSGTILEVGAGIGANMPFLQSDIDDWICLEPDTGLVEVLVAASDHRKIVAGTIDSLQARPNFDTVLYIDVLEHVADDKSELESAALRMRPGGHLIVLAPAHAWLYSKFDAAVGHHRRYSRDSLVMLTPPRAQLSTLRNLDSAGVVASLANRFLLRSPQPTLRQIRTWDRFLVPLSWHIDRWLGYRIGKSILAVWRIGH